MGANPLSLALVVSTALSQAAIPFPCSSFQSVSGLARVTVASMSFPLICWVKHQISLVRHRECLEADILCSEETVIEHGTRVFIVDIQR